MLVAAVASLQYVAELGTYTDSWNFLANLATAPDQSVAGLYRSLARELNVAVRPLQVAWYILFHKLSPGDTLAAHVASHVLYGVAIAIFYAALRRLPATRQGAFAIVMLYACAPNYVAARMWYAAHQTILALLFFATALLLVALYAGDPRTARGHWLLAPIALASAASCLAYELFAFVLLAMPVLVWSASGRRLHEQVHDRRLHLATLAVLLPVVATSLYKISFDYGFTVPQEAADLPRFAMRVAGMYARLAWVQFGAVGALAPGAAAGIATGPYLSLHALTAVALCAALLALVGWRRWLPADPAPTRPAGRTPARRDWAFAAVGGLVFALAYVPLVANFFYSTTHFGDGTRIHVAGALGVALVFYAGLHAIERRRRGWGAALLALYCLSGIFIQVSIGRMWAEASIEQGRRYEAMLRAAGPLAPSDTVLLYGACPYHGAAPVFYTSWGLSGRLRLDARVPASRGDVLTAASRIEPDALVTVLYNAEQRYPYRGLVVFDIAAGTATRIDSYGEARRFFASHPLSQAVPCRYAEGNGTDIYGLRPARSATGRED